MAENDEWADAIVVGNSPGEWDNAPTIRSAPPKPKNVIEKYGDYVEAQGNTLQGQFIKGLGGAIEESIANDPLLPALLKGVNAPVGAIASGLGKEYSPITPGGFAQAVTSPGAARFLAEGTLLAGTAALTGGLPLWGRLAAAAGAGAYGSLATEFIDPSEAPYKRAAVSGAFNVGGELVSTGLNKIAKLRKDIVVDPENRATEIVDDYLKGASRDDVDNIITDAVLGAKRTMKADADKLFLQLNNMAGVASTSLDDAIARAEQLARTHPNHQLPRDALAFLNRAKELYPDGVPLSVAKQVYSDILARARNAARSEVALGGEKYLGDEIAAGVRKGMDEAASGIGPEAKKAMDDALEFYANEYALTFKKDDYIKNILKEASKEYPDRVYKIAIERATPQQMLRFQDVIKDPDTWERIRGAATHDILEKASSSGMLDGHEFYKLVTAKGGNMNAAKLRLLLGQEGYESILKVATTLRDTSSIAPALRVYWRNGNVTFTSVVMDVLSLAPRMAIKVMRNPTAAKLLSIGMKSDPNSDAARRAFAQVSALATKMAFEENRKEAEAKYGPDDTPTVVPAMPMGAIFGDFREENP